jgi:regulator of cell morphogenesis and NO signaling
MKELNVTTIEPRDHDPKPLYYSLLHEREGQFEWEYVAQGPEEWKVKIAKK